MKKLILLLGFMLFCSLAFGQTSPFNRITNSEPEYLSNIGTQVYKFSYGEDVCIVSYDHFPMVENADVLNRPVYVFRKHNDVWIKATEVIQKDISIPSTHKNFYWTGFGSAENNHKDGYAVKLLDNGNVLIFLVNYQSEVINYVEYFTYKILILIPNSNNTFKHVIYNPDKPKIKHIRAYRDIVFTNAKDIDINMPEFELSFGSELTKFRKVND